MYATQSDINNLHAFLSNEDRGGAYIYLYNIIGESQLVTLAQVSTYSGVVVMTNMLLD